MTQDKTVRIFWNGNGNGKKEALFSKEQATILWPTSLFCFCLLKL
jgi:hypothetical protein